MTLGACKAHIKSGAQASCVDDMFVDMFVDEKWSPSMCLLMIIHGQVKFAPFAMPSLFQTG